jgi:hypothetical protein
MSYAKPFSSFNHGSMNTLSSATPISDEELMAFAPSIFREVKGEERSERYSHIPTSAIHAAMKEAGFYPVKVVKQRARAADHTPESRQAALIKESFMKHLIMYRHPDALSKEGSPYHGQVGYVGDHAGRCSVQMFCGLLEVLCGNGLVAGRVAEAIRLGHVKLDVASVIDAAIKMMASIGVVASWREALQGTPLSYGQAKEMAEEALLLRWERDEAPIFNYQLLSTRRVEDRVDNVWGAYQVIEENLRLGRQQPYASWARVQKQRENSPDVIAKRATVVRPINALDATLSMETALSNLADDWYRSMKVAA